MTAQQLTALRLYSQLTAGTFDAWRLAGSHLATTRANLLTQLTGTKTPQVKAGVNAVNLVFRGLMPDLAGECEAEVCENFAAWATVRVQQPEVSCCIRDGCGAPYSMNAPETRDANTLRPFWKRYCPKHRTDGQTHEAITEVRP